MNFNELLDKLKHLTFESIFPLYRKPSDVENLLKSVGIYLAIILVSILLIILFGHIFILGILLWIIGVIATLYGIVGMFAELLKFMKYN